MSNFIKIFIGKGKPDKFKQIRLSIKMSKITDDLIFTAKNGGKYLSAYVAVMREPDEDGNTHTVFCLEPQKSESRPTNNPPPRVEYPPAHTQAKANAYQPQKEEVAPWEDEEDIPF